MAELSIEQIEELEVILQSDLRVGDALEQMVTLKALVDLAKDRDSILRAFLRRKADEHEQTTGTPLNASIRGVGRAQVTQSAERLVITDDTAWGDWLRRRYPERTLVRDGVNQARLAALCREDPELAERLTIAGVLVPEVVGDEGLAAEILQTAGRTPAGGLVDPETGELLDAIVVPGARADLRVTCDKAAVTRRKRELLEAGSEFRPLLAAASD